MSFNDEERTLLSSMLSMHCLSKMDFKLNDTKVHTYCLVNTM